MPIKILHILMSSELCRYVDELNLEDVAKARHHNVVKVLTVLEEVNRFIIEKKHIHHWENFMTRCICHPKKLCMIHTDKHLLMQETLYVPCVS